MPSKQGGTAVDSRLCAGSTGGGFDLLLMDQLEFEQGENGVICRGLKAVQYHDPAKGRI